MREAILHGLPPRARAGRGAGPGQAEHTSSTSSTSGIRTPLRGEKSAQELFEDAPGSAQNMTTWSPLVTPKIILHGAQRFLKYHLLAVRREPRHSSLDCQAVHLGTSGRITLNAMPAILIHDQAHLETTNIFSFTPLPPQIHKFH